MDHHRGVALGYYYTGTEKAVSTGKNWLGEENKIPTVAEPSDEDTIKLRTLRRIRDQQLAADKAELYLETAGKRSKEKQVKILMSGLYPYLIFIILGPSCTYIRGTRCCCCCCYNQHRGRPDCSLPAAKDCSFCQWRPVLQGILQVCWNELKFKFITCSQIFPTRLLDSGDLPDDHQNTLGRLEMKLFCLLVSCKM